MIEEVVNRVAELYKNKSDLLNELSILHDNSNNFKIGYDSKNYLSTYGIFSFKNISESFLEEIKTLTKNHIQQRINEIDNELSEL